MSRARQLAVVAAVAALFAACGGCSRVAIKPGHAAGDTTRIARVEHGLLPTVAIRGRPDTAYVLADRMRRYRVPAVSIAVIDGGRLAWSRAYGVLEAGGAQPADPATLFQAGSISKAIAAVAAMRCVERGLLALDEDVNRRLLAWKVPAGRWSAARPVTLRGLLSHGSGLNVPSFPGYTSDAAIPTVLQVLEGAPPANTPPVRVEIEPGAEWRYSGGGMTVVQQLLADVSGRPFSEVLRETVLDPAGMTHTVAEQPLAPARAASAATGHSAGAPVAGRWRVHPELAAAGLWSTAPDLARFGLAMLHAIRGGSGGLLRPETAREMVTRQIGDWGLGFALGEAGESTTVGHDGSTVGYAARLLVLPATGQGIAVMTNGESEALLDEIVRAVEREYAWPVRPRTEKTVAMVDPEGYAALAGRYRVTVGERNFDFVVDTSGVGAERRLLITGSSGQPGELLPLSALRFFSQETGNEFTFEREGNAVTSMVIDQQGQRFTARRLP
ncbi:MAG TPA: serine hydrolase domain-containing protein [Gemmatimonadales bacterium]|nr:serine hydrolase domain-containing protein [Gemmatimonadales bacterium]